MTLSIPPLPDGPCNDGNTVLLAARCVEGVWQLGWIDADEFGGTRAAAGGCRGQKPTTVIDAAVAAVAAGYTLKQVRELVGFLTAA